MKPISYEGKENYVFISYSHKDTRQVLEIVQRLCDHGIRVWYDDGITPGSEWPENIAQHLNDCHLFLAFVSNNYMASANCRREITYALNRKKEFLAIFLEETEVTPGMELQLSVQQNVMMYQYLSMDQFMDRLFKNEVIHQCKLPQQVEELAMEEPAQKMKQEPAEKAAQKMKQEPTNKTTQKMKQEPAEKAAPKTAKKTPIIAAAAILLVVVAVGAFALLGGVSENAGKITIADEIVSKQEHGFHFRDTEVTAEKIEELKALPNLNYLYFDNCKIDADLALLDELNLIEISIENCPGALEGKVYAPHSEILKAITITNCGLKNENLDLSACPALNRIHVSDNPDLTDISLLALEGIAVMDISGTGITSLSGMKSQESLHYISFNDTAIEDVTELSQCGELTKIYADNTPVSSLAPLAGLTNLSELSFRNCKIAEVKDEMASLSLQKLYLSGNGLTDLSGFANCTVLQEVDFTDNNLEHLEWLAKNVETLEKVNVSNSGIAFDDIEFLSSNTNMQELMVNGIAMEDLHIIQNMTELIKLQAVGCGIKDIADLEGKTKLHEISLASNEITDMSPLNKSASENHLSADLSDNKIESLSVGEEEIAYVRLSLMGNPIVSMDQSFVDRVTIFNLFIDFNDSMLTNSTENSLISSWYIVDCPADMQVKTKEIMKSVRVNFVTREEAEEAFKL